MGHGPGSALVKHVLILLLKVYRLVVSPLYGNVCRYYPSCSAYALRAVEVHGAVKGTWLAARRVLRCHPWAPGGYDPVPGTPEFTEEVRDQARRATTIGPAAAEVSPQPHEPYDQIHEAEDATMASRRGVN